MNILVYDPGGDAADVLRRLRSADRVEVCGDPAAIPALAASGRFDAALLTAEAVEAALKCFNGANGGGPMWASAPTQGERNGAGSAPLLRVQCFGHFAVFAHEKPLKFRRSKTLALFAYLVDRRGAPVTVGEICAVLWEDEEEVADQKNYFRVLLRDLKATLAAAGAEDVLIQRRNQYSVDPALLDCDFYTWQDGGGPASAFGSGYMEQFSWAEERAGMIFGKE